DVVARDDVVAGGGGGSGGGGPGRVSDDDVVAAGVGPCDDVALVRVGQAVGVGADAVGVGGLDGHQAVRTAAQGRRAGHVHADVVAGHDVRLRRALKLHAADGPGDDVAL